MNNALQYFFIFGAKYLYLIIIICAFAWLLKQPRAKQQKFLVITCICFPLVFIISMIAGNFFYNPRPFVVGHFLPLIPYKANNGFPSHHMLIVSSIASIVFIFSRRLSLYLWALALVVGVSRVYVGVHHPIDIAAGMAIPIIVVILINAGIKFLENFNL